MTPVRDAPLAILGLALLGCGADVGSVGAVFGRDAESRTLIVRDAPKGAGDAEAALLPGDEVLMIDGWYVKGMDGKAVRARLRGEVGSTVRLTVVRGSEVHHFRVRRGPLGERRAPPPKEERIAE